MTYSWPEHVLNRLGLWKAVQGIPGLTPIALLAVLLSYVFLAGAELTEPTRMLSAAAIGVLLALIGYYAGNFWDSTLFDPCYALKGRWIHTEKRPFHLFAAGADLARCRDRAIEAVFGRGHSGEGIYRECKLIAKGASRSQGSEIAHPLVLSKFIRSLIWPSVLGGIGLLGFGLWSLVADPKHRDKAMLMAGVSLLVLAVLVLIPYFNLRVEHMMRLYEFAAKARSSRASGARQRKAGAPAGGPAVSGEKRASPSKEQKNTR